MWLSGVEFRIWSKDINVLTSFHHLFLLSIHFQFLHLDLSLSLLPVWLLGTNAALWSWTLLRKQLSCLTALQISTVSNGFANFAPPKEIICYHFPSNFGSPARVAQWLRCCLKDGRSWVRSWNLPLCFRLPGSLQPSPAVTRRQERRPQIPNGGEGRSSDGLTVVWFELPEIHLFTFTPSFPFIYYAFRPPKTLLDGAHTHWLTRNSHLHFEERLNFNFASSLFFSSLPSSGQFPIL